MGEILRRVLANVDDTSLTLYSDVEASDAVNLAKDEVVNLTRIYTDQFPQTSTTLAFDSGVKEVALPTDCLDVLLVEYYPTSTSAPNKRRTVTFGNQHELEASGFYIRRTNYNTIYLGRNDPDSAISVVVYYRPTVADHTATITTATTASFTFGPTPADNLIIIKATNILLSARSRKTQMENEMKLNQMYLEVLSRFNQAEPRHVHLKG